MSNPYHTKAEVNWISDIQQMLWNKRVDETAFMEIYEMLSEFVDIPKKEKKMNCTPISICSTGMISLDCCNASIPQPHKSCVKEKESNMYNNKSVNVDLNIETNIAKSQDLIKTSYLENELYAVSYAKEKDARKVFYMDADQAPTTPKEYVERIKAGTFTFKDRFTNADGEWLNGYGGCYTADYAIEWRTVPADKVGYKAALDKVKVAMKDAERTIKIGTPAEGLAALKAFEAMTIN